MDQDFAPILFYFAHSPDSNMNQFARVSRYTPQGILAIRRHVLQEEVQGQVVSARPLSPQEEGEAIRRVFHLAPTGISWPPKSPAPSPLPEEGALDCPTDPRPCRITDTFPLLFVAPHPPSCYHKSR